MNFEKKWQNFRNRRLFNEFYFIAVALILAFGVISTTGEILNTEKPVVTVVSCSMYPKYDVGDIIVVKGEEFDDYQVDDVIVYDAETENLDIPIIHRMIEKNENYVQTRGDNTRGQHEFEKRVEPDQIHGKSIFSIPRVGLVKILAMDVLGYSGDKPFEIDNTPDCRRI